MKNINAMVCEFEQWRSAENARRRGSLHDDVRRVIINPTDMDRIADQTTLLDWRKSKPNPETEWEYLVKFSEQLNDALARLRAK